MKKKSVQFLLLVIVLTMSVATPAFAARLEFKTGYNIYTGSTIVTVVDTYYDRVGYNIFGSLAKPSQTVGVVQKVLVLANDPPGPIDGSYGNQTIKALKAYQNWRGLTADAIVGPLTWAELDKTYKLKGSPNLYIYFPYK
ncbi:MAG: peptidoglycan-binding protein [Peptococcaceae bacterium]|nr:peptidoglycan-binding protein [Peptococcaceae bacterium]